MYKLLIISALITTTLSMTSDINCLDVCKDKPLGYKLPDPTDCLGYILCHKDFMLQQYCASGMKFDENKLECVVGKCPPYKCNCETCDIITTTTKITPNEPSTSTVTPDTEPSTTTTPAYGSTPDCSLYPNGTLVPHSEHCRCFWTCLNSKAIIRFCELGMWYDRVRFVCNYPELVDCPANQD